MICKKKTSSYKNWLLRCKEVAHKHRQRFFKLPEPASLFTYHRQRWFFVSARSGKLFYIWRYLVWNLFLKLALATILPLKCKERLKVVILLSKYDSNWETPNKLELPSVMLLTSTDDWRSRGNACGNKIYPKTAFRDSFNIRSNTNRYIKVRPHIVNSL